MSFLISAAKLAAPGLDNPDRSLRPSAAWLRSAARRAAPLVPNGLVRWAFYLSIFAIPFSRLYVPGTGERVGVTRIIHLLIVGAILAQPRVCLRFMPVALLWFLAYYGLRVGSGLWLAPEFSSSWWSSALDWLQFLLPWTWLAFNLVQYPRLSRGGLWSLVWGCALCAGFHLLGVGVTTVDTTVDEIRTTVFGENANVVGANYATALIALIGIGMFKDFKPSQVWLVLPLIGLVGLAMAKTGSRTAFLMVAVGIAVLLLQAESFSSRFRRYSALALIGFIMAGSVWLVPTVLERFRDIDPHNVGHGNPRARMAPVLWEMFLRSPIYGSGPDQYQFELTRRSMPYLLQEQKTISSHNLVLLILVETGMIGLLVFCAGLYKPLAAAWRARIKPCGFVPLALFLPFLISALLVSVPTPNQVFWLAVAYALAGAA